MSAQPEGADCMVLRDGPILAQHLGLNFAARPDLQRAGYADIPHRCYGCFAGLRWMSLGVGRFAVLDLDQVDDAGEFVVPGFAVIDDG
jgi:hypothetical protein